MRSAEKRFGGVKAVDGVSLAVERGTITALIGPNGSGKTTLFNLIDGTMPLDRGEIWFDGGRINGSPPIAGRIAASAARSRSPASSSR